MITCYTCGSTFSTKQDLNIHLADCNKKDKEHSPSATIPILETPSITSTLNDYPVSTNIQGNNLEIDKDVTNALTSKSMSVTTGSKVTDKTESKCTIRKKDFQDLETHKQAHQYRCDVCDLEAAC